MPANTPPATDPILERAVQHLIDTVNGIAARHLTEGGFYYANYTAERPHPTMETAVVDLRVQIVQGLAEAREEASSTCSLVTGEYITLRADAILSERSGESIDRKLNLIRADLIKAVMDDRQRGGLAITTDFAYSEINDEVSDLSQGRIDLVFIVTLQQSWLDPTSF